MSLRTAVPHLSKAIAEKRSSRLSQLDFNKRFVSHVRSPPSHQPRQPAAVPSPASRRPTQHEKNWPAQISHIKDPKEARSFSLYFKISSGFAFVIGLYCTYLVVDWRKNVVNHANSDDHLPFNADVSSRWKELGRDFDDEVELSEKLMRMRGKRKRLVDNAYGNVLEVSVGTGRNLNYYNLRGFEPTKPSRRNIITHLTLNDQSGVIIAAAETKLENIVSRQEKSSTPTATVDFVIGDAGVSGVIERPKGGYDTIVQTMGVCSMVDPVGFLRRMGQLCRQPGEKSNTPDRWRAKDDDGKGGQILLLEHGRGYFDWLNWILDTGASLHAHRFGCWWNKDIEKVVQQSGLEIEKIKRYHGGTTWMIVLRPKASSYGNETEKDSRVNKIQTMSSREFNWSGRN